MEPQRWIAKNAPGVDVIVSHPQPVRTGLTLFDAMGGHNFPSLLFFETGYDLFTLRQASRRSWRIGQKHPCRVYYLYYQETMQARAMGLMARKLDASLALEGQFSPEGLAAMSADSGSLTMELAKSLVENIDFGDAERVWEKLRSVQSLPEPITEEGDDGFFLWATDTQVRPIKDRSRRGGPAPAGPHERRPVSKSRHRAAIQSLLLTSLLIPLEEIA